MSTVWIILVVVVLMVLVMVVVPWLQRTAIEPAELSVLLADGARIIDVRSPDEFARGSVSGAINLPVDHIGKTIASVVPDTATPILLFCVSGMRSGMAARRLQTLGYTTVVNLGTVSRTRGLLQAADNSR